MPARLLPRSSAAIKYWYPAGILAAQIHTRPAPAQKFYDSATQEWHLTGNFNTPRAYHSAITLPDGTVLAVGGEVAGGSSLASAERYYPSSSTQTVTVELAGTIAPTTFSVAGTGCSPGTYTAYPAVPVNWTPGSSCQVNVLPPSGYSFTSWSDGSTANPRTFIAPATATTYTATIAQGGSSGPAAIQATGGTPQSATVNSAFASQLSAKVTNSSGNGVSGAIYQVKFRFVNGRKLLADHVGGFIP